MTRAEEFCLVNGWRDPETRKRATTDAERAAVMARFKTFSASEQKAGLVLWAARFALHLDPVTGEPEMTGAAQRFTDAGSK